MHRHEADVAELGDGDETPSSCTRTRRRAPAGRHAGLYHYALLYPSREELARAAVRLAATRTPIEGASDHGTHEAIYLPDPDGNGIELAADRPREQWPRRPRLRRRPGAARRRRADGHHRGRGSPPRSRRRACGWATCTCTSATSTRACASTATRSASRSRRNLGSAAFVSAGGYHHHLGFNVWRGKGVGPAAAHGRTRRWTVQLPTAADVAAVRERLDDTEPFDGGFLARDPWGTAVAFVAAPA